MYDPAPRHEKVIRLREAGRTYTQIGDALGISRARAAQLYSTGLVRRKRLELSAKALLPVTADMRVEDLPVDSIVIGALLELNLLTVGEAVLEDWPELSGKLLRFGNLDRRKLMVLRKVLDTVG